jgi:tRNA-2-methylthio-N6-dimethylallyladenosine synthase
LQELLQKQQRQFNKACIGRVLPVLLEKPGRHDGQLVGRSPYFQSVHVDAPAADLGAIAAITISRASTNSLSGSFVEATSA